jgi:hypothetical protein
MEKKPEFVRKVLSLPRNACRFGGGRADSDGEEGNLLETLRKTA